MDKLKGAHKRIIQGKHIDWKKGELFILNIPSITFPIYSFIEIIARFQDEFEGTNRLLYEVGEKQTLLAIDYAKNKFGLRKEKDIIDSVMEQGVMLGYGEFKLTMINLEKGYATFKNEVSPFAKYYRTLLGVSDSPVDAYYAGANAGLIEAITGKNLACVETSCMAKGDPYCLYEVMPKDVAEKKFPDTDFSYCIGPDNIRGNVKKQKSVASSAKR